MTIPLHDMSAAVSVMLDAEQAAAEARMDVLALVITELADAATSDPALS